MTVLAITGFAITAGLLCLVTVVQILYLESLRLRSRDLPALQFFKETLEERLAVRDETGVLSFSVIKHSLVLLLGLSALSMTFADSGPGWRSFLEGGLLAWLTMLVTTYVLAQTLYRKTSGHWLLPFVPVMRLAILMVRPLTALLGFFESLVQLGEPDKPNQETPSPSGDIEALISAGAEEGIIQEEDRKLIESVVAFGDKTVREVMTPRPKIVGIEANHSLDDLRELVIHEQFSRIPVFEGTIDKVTGFVHVRDMFELNEADRVGRKVKELSRPISFVPETKPVPDLLREMQSNGAHMAIVIDEYGNTAGLVTMEDLVEEILGEIRDEHEPDRDFKKEPDGAIVVAGSLDLDRLHELVDFKPHEETESTTIAGLVTEWMGHVPNVGEVVERDGIRLEVLAGDELKVEQVRISKVEEQTHA